MRHLKIYGATLPKIKSPCQAEDDHARHDLSKGVCVVRLNKTKKIAVLPFNEESP